MESPSAASSASTSPVEVMLGNAGRRNSREDVLLDGRLIVRSRDGVALEDKSLLRTLPQGRSGRLLLLGDPGTTVWIAARLLNPGAEVTAWYEDHWSFQRAQEDAENVPEHLRPAFCLSAEAPEGPFDMVALSAGKNGQTDLLREIIRASSNRLLRRGGLLYCGYGGESEAFIRREIEKAFGAVTMTKTARRHSYGFVARAPEKPLVNEATGWAEFTIKEGEEILSLQGRLGVFCHDRLDQGTRALLAVSDIEEPSSICDLGCGTGVVSVALGRRYPNARLTLVDSSARAVESARRNLEAHGIAERATLILQSDPVAAMAGARPHDVMIANPPYYGNLRIAAAFLGAAVAGLRSGGRLHLVTKGPNWYRENLPEGLVLDAEGNRGGYTVLEFRRR